jgi:hypothetical protein
MTFLCLQVDKLKQENALLRQRLEAMAKSGDSENMMILS